MYRALPISRRVAFTSRNGVVKVVRRRIATEAAAPIVPKRKKGIVRRILWVTTGLTGTFYVGSAFASFYSQPYYDFFSDKVPLGQSMLEYAEAHNWDTLTAQQVLDSTKSTALSIQRFVSDKINGVEPAKAVEPTKSRVERKAKEVKTEAVKVVNEAKSTVETLVTKAKQEIHNKEGGLTWEATALAKHEAREVKDELNDLVRKAEIALADTRITATPPSTSEAIRTTSAPPSEIDGKLVYEVPLPLGFEPPPGFVRPVPPKKEVPVTGEPTPVTIPLIAPAVSSIVISEPIITHLASTIDDLASYLDTNPTAAPKVSDVLETAKSDLTALADRIEKAKEDERLHLEIKLDEQTREYTQKLLELEMEAQDKLDNQEQDFRKYFDEERTQLIQAYRAKLDHELRTQTELINERLREEVVAQGIELQRRWIREVKVRVEQERGGRLGKLEELSSHLKRLERVALDNSSYLDENIRVHALWSAVRAVTSSALTSPVRKPFREELRVLRHIASAREDPIVAVALQSLDSSDVPDVGVEPFADLASWFSSSVVPKLAHVALVPDENAGVLSYLASHLLSGLQFHRQGLVTGNDVLSVVARAEHYLNEKDLDSATRELNQLTGAAKVLLHDWLEAARRRLEVEQALEVVQTQASLASLLVI